MLQHGITHRQAGFDFVPVTAEFQDCGHQGDRE